MTALTQKFKCHGWKYEKDDSKWKTLESDLEDQLNFFHGKEWSIKT